MPYPEGEEWHSRSNRRAELNPLAARRALDEAAAALREGLRLQAESPPPAVPATGLAADQGRSPGLAEPGPMMTWLERRLRLAVEAGLQLGDAGRALLASTGHPEPAARR